MSGAHLERCDHRVRELAPTVQWCVLCGSQRTREAAGGAWRRWTKPGRRRRAAARKAARRQLELYDGREPLGDVAT